MAPDHAQPYPISLFMLADFLEEKARGLQTEAHVRRLLRENNARGMSGQQDPVAKVRAGRARTPIDAAQAVRELIAELQPETRGRTEDTLELLTELPAVVLSTLQAGVREWSGEADRGDVLRAAARALRTSVGEDLGELVRYVDVLRYDMGFPETVSRRSDGERAFRLERALEDADWVWRFQHRGGWADRAVLHRPNDAPSWLLLRGCAGVLVAHISRLGSRDQQQAIANGVTLLTGALRERGRETIRPLGTPVDGTRAHEFLGDTAEFLRSEVAKADKTLRAAAPPPPPAPGRLPQQFDGSGKRPAL